MSSQTSDTSEIPYHLRAARLRWAAFAVTLDSDELEGVEGILSNPAAPGHTFSMARLLLCLHQRQELSKLCSEIPVSRRRLLDLADRLTTKEGRRQLLSLPLPSRGRPPRAV
ncbi:MAG: hypothetical protein JWO94_2369 [Verrucomicrobiaceae bacterium]|nr:hypothetical protein [Verrucomicrobiaceae bacterium]